jgi:hypothetical protein
LTGQQGAVAILGESETEPLAFERWFSEDRDLRTDPAVAPEILAFIEQQGAQSITMADRILGCSHEEGIDDPEGPVCPQYSFWG